MMIGSAGERMLAITVPYVRSWNVWYKDTGNSPDGVAPLQARVDAAARAAGRDPSEIEATIAVLVRMAGGSGRYEGGGVDEKTKPIQGPPDVIAEELRRYAQAGVAEVQLVVDPITVDSIEALAPALELLDR